eukprot:CAMPEP_0172713128 /NCGR_PEP_ID=MMETSP1074-20121228/61501_1 /TAXON_ID=2916 /ORGANISM="Ceratium fusus, Strain PA161109" /LENGTH=493 /DNA_ID=CAMNT_0013537157 /DNA_START=59 /DNA_END=1540 /DNA_ORIENTATION=-
MHGTTRRTDYLYQQLQPVARNVLEVVLESEFEDSTHAFTLYVASFRFADGTDIAAWMPPIQPEALMRGHVLEGLAHWIRGKAHQLDTMIPVAQAGLSLVSEQLQACTTQLEQACFQSSPSEVLVEFLFACVVELLGREAACLGSALAGMMIQQADRHEIVHMAQSPSTLLALMVRKLEEMQAKVGKVIMELYNDMNYMSYDDSKNLLMMFFQYYTVEIHTGTLEVHETNEEPQFVDSQFRVNLVDSFGCLMKLLCHLETVTGQANREQTGGRRNETVLAVDFEGVKLCRHGPLCLVQMMCSDDPTLVYVLDVHILGRRAFTLTTPQGTCMKGLLEEHSIRKIWFDPRNDVDALYHQFGIIPRGIFDLQLAEVADRRNRGLNVYFVQGLQKCLVQCADLQADQKVFADRINQLGKSLFEPTNGGQYEIFQLRPLNPVILVYAAHDSRYLLVLYEHFLQSLNQGWIPRVLQAGDQRGRWWSTHDYVTPSPDAPDF